FAMGTARRAPRIGTRRTSTSAIAATTIPATTSSQKWFAVASTQNQTHTGQAAQSALKYQRRQATKSATPTTSASAAWRLGIAAYGLPKISRTFRVWLTPSMNPKLGNIHGGAVGTTR